MPVHGETPRAVPLPQTLSQQSTGKLFNGIGSGNSSRLDLVPFQTIAETLGIEIKDVRRIYNTAIRKLNRNNRLLELHRQIESERAAQSRRILPHYTRTIRFAVTDVAPHEMTAPTAELQP